MARRVSGFLAVTFAAHLFAQQNVLDSISSATLQRNVSFLASDQLEGRRTPSKGLNLAADFIAGQFQAAGLEPIEGTYFQEAPYYDLTVRNVVGLLRGSDAALSNTYIIVSAHYDHLGLAKKGRDRVFHGANDNASGVASAIELANALARMEPRPKRSFVFIAYFGEEAGELGSFYYAAHPLVPLAATIAQLNLEQLGRAKEDQRAYITGFDFTGLPGLFADAAKGAGVRIEKDRRSSDYFKLSDNLALAEQGIPSHTLTVAYSFPDYHKVTDTADKINYLNLAAVNRGIVLGLLRLGSEQEPPKWNGKYRPAARYVEAAHKLHAAPGN